mgnify:CR=1 FL=1
MTALAEHIAQQKARGDRLLLWSLCPVRGCLSFAPVGRHCGAHWVRDLVRTVECNRLAMEALERFKARHSEGSIVMGGAQ